MPLRVEFGLMITNDWPLGRNHGAVGVSRLSSCTSAKEGMEQGEMFESQDFDSSWWRHAAVETQLRSDMLFTHTDNHIYIYNLPNLK